MRLKGRLEFLNREVAEILGITLNEMDGLSDKELEGQLDAVRVSRDAARRQHRIKMFVLQCRLRGESHLRVVCGRSTRLTPTRTVRKH